MKRTKWSKLTTKCIRLASELMTSRPGHRPLFLEKTRLTYGKWEKERAILTEDGIEVSTESVRASANTVQEPVLPQSLQYRQWVRFRGHCSESWR